MARTVQTATLNGIEDLHKHAVECYIYARLDNRNDNTRAIWSANGRLCVRDDSHFPLQVLLLHFRGGRSIFCHDEICS
jgi:hypothetical protein